jgi:ligand-binding sensor domain-containing protein
MDQQRLPSEEVLWMTQDDLGNKFYAGRKGLSVVRKNGDFRIRTRENTGGALGSDSITGLALDRYRALWIATDGGGLSVLDGEKWTHYTRENTAGGLPDDGVLALALRGEECWAATRNGFALLRGGVWTPYTGDRISGRLPNRVVTALAVDSAGDKWLGTIGGLVRFTGSSWTRFTRENTEGGLPHDGVTALAVDPKGALWVGTQAGWARRDRAGKWTNFRSAAGLGDLAGEVTYSLSIGSAGEVWVCAKGGAARFADGRWELFTKNTAPALMTRYVYYAMPGREGETWFATEKGVVAMTPVKEED